MKEKIIVFGLGVTGISSAKALSKLNFEVFTYVDKKDDNYFNILEELKEYAVNDIGDLEAFDWAGVKYLLKSPGIRLDNQFVELAKSHDVEVVSDIELAYRLFPQIKFLAITGTNGKTTTTHMVSSILTSAGIQNQIVGNIGVGLLWKVVSLGLDFVYVLEMSSFQLASSDTFRSKIACITNISPDHIDWHGSEEEYIRCKLHITENQRKDDILILNADDHSSVLAKKVTQAKVREISTRRELQEGSYCVGENVYIDANKTPILKSDLKLVGEHNLQNALFAIETCFNYGVDIESIRKGVQAIEPIEHRIEKVREINGVTYYNDSKGTNVDSTIKALDGFKEKIVLIAGGYDKKANYEGLFEARSNIKEVILFGQTKFDIEKVAKNFDIKSEIVGDLEEAVNRAYKVSDANDVVLFSPACASWDMYNNFEERGKHFKELVNKL